MTNKQLKYIILLRHGELDNPSNITYNRDIVAKTSKDIIHLSEIGKEHLLTLGEVIKENKFNVTSIFHSPQTRTKESAEVLAKKLSISTKKVVPFDEINEVYAPGPYLEGISITEWVKRGNLYSKKWEKYNHEKPKEIIKRMKDGFFGVASNLKLDETAILVSHGDPIAWFINYIDQGKIPDPAKLGSLIYPAKGEAIVFRLTEKNKIVGYYRLKNKSSIISKIY